MSEHERVTCAYHEAGHAVVAALLPDADPLHKVTIIPRGRALGVTMQLPEADRHTHSKPFIEAQIAILMGGRVAEELFLRQMTSGASNDIERATELARKMVCEFGMSPLGPVHFRRLRPTNRAAGFSEETARRVDDEIRALVMRGYETARADRRAGQSVIEQFEEVLKHRVPIVTTTEEAAYPSRANRQLAARLDAAARKAKVAVLGTGGQPRVHDGCAADRVDGRVRARGRRSKCCACRTRASGVCRSSRRLAPASPRGGSPIEWMPDRPPCRLDRIDPDDCRRLELEARSHHR